MGGDTKNIYQDSLEKMVRFLRFHGDDRPEVVRGPRWG